MAPLSQEATEASTGDAIVDQGAAAAIGSAWPVKITDTSNTATVKAASTAPLAGDTALVVTISPNGNTVSSALPVSATATLTNVAASVSSVALLSSNASRKGWQITNDSTSILYVNLGATASATAYTVRLQPNSFYESGNITYTGAINGIWVSAAGSARMTELT